MKKIRILLADDHVLVRAGIRSLLEQMSGIEVVGEAGDGREAVKLIRQLRPDIVLMDVAMAQMNGIEATGRIKKAYKDIQVIILSMYSNEEYVLQALQAGASGYLLKDAATLELELAVRAVSRNETYLSPGVSKHVIDSYRKRILTDQQPVEQLTPRQREVLQLIAEGRTTKEIASILKVAIKTVETHRTQMMERLNIHDIAGLVRYAIRVGLIRPQ
ncbi:MAG: response regulator transcription factor [Proteobacteria bacterium]|nr:response regulator transcription factor [Pseudomonadota bacterium]